MMNLVQLQEQLKDYSQDQLAQEMQMPSGSVPQYLVLGELQRRQRMQNTAAMQAGKQANESTVAEEAVAAAGLPQGGLGDMARAMAPQTDMGQNTGSGGPAGAPPQRMASGGVVRAAGDTFMSGRSTVIDGTPYTLTPEGMVVNARTGERARSEEADAVRSKLNAAAPELPMPPMAQFEPVGPGIMSPTQEDLDRAAAGRRAVELYGGGAGPQMPNVPDGPGPLSNIPAMASEVGRPPGPAQLPLPNMDVTGGAEKTAVNPPPLTMPMNAMEELYASGAVTAYGDMEYGPPRRTGAPAEDGSSWWDQLWSNQPGEGGASAWIGEDANQPGWGWGSEAPAPDMATTGTPLTIPEGGAAELLPPAATEKSAPKAGGGGAGGGSAAGASDLERRLEQDKWLSLAKFGMALMASKAPTFGHAMGEAGLAAISDFQEAQQRFEDNRMARQVLAAKMARGSRGPKPKAFTASDINALNDMIENIDTQLMGIGMEDMTREQLAALSADRQRLVQLRDTALAGRFAAAGVAVPSTNVTPDASLMQIDARAPSSS